MDPLTLIVPVAIGGLVVAAMSAVRDPDRRRELNAFLVAGASGIYLSNPALGPWQLLPCAAIFACAYLGRRSWRWIGLAWLLHAALDVVHAVKGVELLPWAPHSALGCAICDPVIAIWCLSGGRPIDHGLRRISPSPTPTSTAR